MSKDKSDDKPDGKPPHTPHGMHRDHPHDSKEGPDVTHDPPSAVTVATVEPVVAPPPPPVPKKRWSITRKGTGLTREVEAETIEDALAKFQDDFKDYCGPNGLQWVVVEMPS
jgi:hypothetical protein